MKDHPEVQTSAVHAFSVPRSVTSAACAQRATRRIAVPEMLVIKINRRDTVVTRYTLPLTFILHLFLSFCWRFLSRAVPETWGYSQLSLVCLGAQSTAPGWLNAPTRIYRHTVLLSRVPFQVNPKYKVIAKLRRNAESCPLALKHLLVVAGLVCEVLHTENATEAPQ